MLRTSWSEHMNNDEVLRKVKIKNHSYTYQEMEIEISWPQLGKWTGTIYTEHFECKRIVVSSE